MSELILTEKEKAAETLLDLDDATVGKLVKHSALQLKASETVKGRYALWVMTCAICLCNLACDSNAEILTHDVEGLTYKGEHRGDWRVTVERRPANDLEV